jgi:hypothetical protein
LELLKPLDFPRVRRCFGHPWILMCQRRWNESISSFSRETKRTRLMFSNYRWLRCRLCDMTQSYDHARPGRENENGRIAKSSVTPVVEIIIDGFGGTFPHRNERCPLLLRRPSTKHCTCYYTRFHVELIWNDVITRVNTTLIIRAWARACARIFIFLLFPHHERVACTKFDFVLTYWKRVLTNVYVCVHEDDLFCPRAR